MRTRRGGIEIRTRQGVTQINQSQARMHQDANQSWTSWHASRGFWSSSEATELKDRTAPLPRVALL